MRIAIAGSSGFVGSHLVPRLEAAGHEVLRLVRSGSPPAHGPAVRWDPARGALDPGELAGVDAVVNLAGANVAARRWTAAWRRRLWDSRVLATRTIVRAMAAAGGPRVLVSASATGYYGDRGDEELDESSLPGEGFLAELARAWEEEALRAGERGVRVVLLRLGVVIGPGGALARMLPPFRLGLGGPLGSGRQWVSWISLRDAAGAVLHALGDAGLSGPVNAVSPHPVRQRDLARVLGRTLHRPAAIPAPAPLLRLALGGMARELLLSSQRVLPRCLEETGFRWEHPELADALAWALDQLPRR